MINSLLSRLVFGLPVFILIGMGCSSPDQAPNVSPLERAHAHNDYEHSRPLLDALDHGYTSIEADIWLVDDQLLVAHDREDTRPDRTLEALYLDPLRDRIAQNGGSVYADRVPLTLLIDIKSEAEATYNVLRDVLADYSDMLTVFENDTTYVGAVSVILSGNRPRAALELEPIRYAAYDGRLEDLYATVQAPLSFIPLVSISWGDFSGWEGEGNLPSEDLFKLRHVVNRAHGEGRKLRFWGTKDDRRVWSLLLAENVDLIGTDDLGMLRSFFEQSGD